MPPVLKRAIAVYEAARVLMGYTTPGYDEISQVAVLQNHPRCDESTQMPLLASTMDSCLLLLMTLLDNLDAEGLTLPSAILYGATLPKAGQVTRFGNVASRLDFLLRALS